MYLSWGCYTVLLLLLVPTRQVVILISYMPLLNSLMLNAQRQANQQGGLRQELLDAITEVEGKQGEVCSICLEPFIAQQKVKELPGCTHQFHTNCIALWLLQSRVCPFCKREITEEQIRAQAIDRENYV